MSLSVALFWADGMTTYAVRLTHIKNAAQTFIGAVATAESKPGVITRVILTDGGDCLCREWKLGEGLTFPRFELVETPEN